MKIYGIHIQNKLEQLEMLLPFIDEEKINKINRYRRDEDKIRAILSDILVRSIIAKELHIGNKDIVFEYNEYGKPKVKNSQGIHFNVSHSGDWVVGIFDDEPVGIDVEKLMMMDYMGIVKSMFHEEEYEWIKFYNPQDQLEKFYELWTLKESYIKMLGKGLSIPLSSFSVVGLKEPSNFALNNQEGMIFLKHHPIDKEYILGTCTKKGIDVSNIHYVTIEEMYHLLATTCNASIQLLQE